ncbi:hypothetical protein IQ255_28685 [Pleurocapsales cyanobacterium LEGE 10410]|nr:hypothetical protein [Pleurocapsales cyanobacterium LEGE 10410]
MKLLLLKTLLQRRARDEGFTLPMVIALGFVMILLGMTNIVKSSEENLNAITQNSSSDALAVAEVGITKYRELLNQNRILTIYNDDQWNTNANVTGQACNDLTTTPTGWEDGGTATAPNDTTKWWELREDTDGDGTDELIGEYRLVSYQYDIDDDDFDSSTPPTNNNGQFSPSDDNANTTDDFTFNDVTYDPLGVIGTSNSPEGYNPTGILTVQGRSTDGSEAQIKVEIPLRINQNDLENLDPALWIGSTDTTYLANLNGNLGSLTVTDGNVVIIDAASAGSSGCSDPADGASYTVISDAREVPSISSIASKRTEAVNAGINNSIPVTSPAVLGKTDDDPYVTPPSGATFDEDIHCANISDCRYYYDLSATDITAVTETDGIAKVTLYVDGNLNINQDLGSNVSSSYLEIYVTNSGSITIDSDSTNTINALIHAPESQLTVNGTGTVKINGSVWVDKFVNNATVEIEPDTTRISSLNTAPSYKLYSTATARTPRPLTGSPTNWVREEVQ